jgi:hypothetical protein
MVAVRIVLLVCKPDFDVEVSNIDVAFIYCSRYNGIKGGSINERIGDCIRRSVWKTRGGSGMLLVLLVQIMRGCGGGDLFEGGQERHGGSATHIAAVQPTLSPAAGIPAEAQRKQNSGAVCRGCVKDRGSAGAALRIQLVATPSLSARIGPPATLKDSTLFVLLESSQPVAVQLSVASHSS